MKIKTKITVFDVILIAFMIVFMIIMVYPMWYSIIGGFSNGLEYARGGVYLLPRGITLENFKALFYDDTIYRAFIVTFLKSSVGTITSLIFTTIVAYGVTRPNLKFKNIYIPFIMFTMFFSGGLIPYFLLINKIKLYNTFWVYIIPTLFSVWNMIIIQSFLREIPASIYESARIDGAGEYRILFSIIMPLATPVLATIALFTFVGHWNSYFDSMMYTSSDSLQTIQYYLKKVITDPAMANGMGAQAALALPDSVNKITPKTIKLAAMTVTALPVVAIYPFLQKYFAKGVTIGAVKG